jgi:uncharacterized protein
MTALFADSSFYVAVVNPRDELHARAIAVAKAHRGRTITTEYVLLETGNRLAKPANRQAFVALVDRLRSDPKVLIVPASTDLFDEGLALFADRSDKEWSLVDCTSLAVMQEQGIREALTADHHFEQAGFVVLIE